MFSTTNTKPNVCTPKDPPTAHTSCVIELYDGADDVGGADLILELVVEFVVVLELIQIDMLLLLTYTHLQYLCWTLLFDCVEPGYAGFINANKHINTISIPVK